MSFWRQLRWRIIGSHLVIVVAGVTILLIATEAVPLLTSYDNIQARITGLTRTENPLLLQQAAQNLLQTFRNALLISLGIAAAGALIAGLFTSILLTRLILKPLHQITQSSQRIAGGHYDERVTVPRSDELAMVAVHFNQMAAALEQVEQQRVALIGNVSHELRTPLTGIEGYLEGMMDGLLPSDTATFAQMYQEVRRLRRLVDDLQALSRVEAGQVSLSIETVDLVPVIERVVNQLRPQADALCLQIDFECSQDRVLVSTDADRSAQVLINMVGNALHYTPEGGQITIRVRPNPPTAEVTVQDTGIGIPPEALPYIFERFYRVDSSRSRSSGGSGVGLTVSRQLAWAMGGDLTASSEGPERGSTFTLTLPLVDIAA